MSVTDNKLTKIGKKLEATELPKGDFPYTFGTKLTYKILIGVLYVSFGITLFTMTFGDSKTLILSEVIKNENLAYILQVILFVIGIATSYFQLFHTVKINRDEITFPTLYNFGKKTVAVDDIEKVSFTETVNAPRGLGLLADIFPSLFSSIEVSLLLNNNWKSFKMLSKERKMVRVYKK